MKYRELIKKVQDYSGFSDRESEEALELVVETLASRLNEGERQDLASQLPEELEDAALAPTSTSKFSAEEMFEELSTLQNIDESHAKKQVLAVWNALQDALTPGEIDDIRSQLPH